MSTTFSHANWHGVFFFFAIVLDFLAFATAFAQISPGELARPHAKLEGMTHCTQCHTLGGGPDPQKCLQCHQEIRRSLIDKSGYHYFITTKQDRACFECHSEHNGRNFNLTFWPRGKNNFDHAQTGYVLEGKHRELKCNDCHQPKHIVHDPRKFNKEVNLATTFLGLEPSCLSCHQDEHQGQLAHDCLTCHNYSGWKPAAKFSHDKAKFRLIGKHRNVECGKCHISVALRNIDLNTQKKFFVKYVRLQFDNCTPCHNDVHSGKFGQDCRKCHDSFGWSRIQGKSFNHSLTRFPLLGLHQRVTCNRCHVSGDMRTRLRFANCTDCHRDAHFGQFADRLDGGRCESCHDVFGFIPAKYDIVQHVRSDYPLTGAHLAVPCVACHYLVDQGKPRERRIFEFPDISCKGCHGDVHKGQFADLVQKNGCESCHQTSEWSDVRFDHNKTRFTLLGKHLVVACRKCHRVVDVGTERERMLFRPMAMACKDCHEDVHQGQFVERKVGARCNRCHTPESWVKLIFDHNRDSLFSLRGAHEKTPCAGCHKLESKAGIQFIRYRPIDRRCVHCHGNK